MKVFMDDLRDTPDGWERTYNVEDTISLLRTHEVTHLSLDNDLGDGQPEGYKVVDWLEETVYCNPNFPMPEVTIHSANATRVEYMHRALKNIERIRQQQIGGN
jgi:NAD+-processing family protein with receiver domain